MSLVAGLVLANCISHAQQPVPASATAAAHQATVPEAKGATRLRLGIAVEKPAEQPFVELPDGKFMVPYTTTISGTDVEFTMIPIPGGKFMMGSPETEEDRFENEGPQFEVSVDPFWMGKYEVTWAEYQKYMMMDDLFRRLHSKGLRIMKDEHDVDGITAPSSLYDPSFTYEAGEERDQPAATITQFAAKQYTKWLSLMADDFYRLPLESEWEYACRAGTTTAYYFGDDPEELEDHAWFIENSDEERHAVGELKPNPWGLYDMYGNVAEWVLDKYNEDGYPPIDGKSVTAAESFKRPTELYPRTVRGGAWVLDPEYCRSAARLGSHKSWRANDPNIPKSPWWYTDEPGTGIGFR
jgi:formylglycine-generating enzyme required for sulfatase activity